MKAKKSLTASSENYLKAIYAIVSKNKAAKAKDISNYLGIGPSSVTEALQGLAARALINYEPYGLITLTEEGEKVAIEISYRHNILADFLENVLCVDGKVANANANKIEYGVSEEVLDKFVKFLEFMQMCSCKEPKWMKSFKYYAAEGRLKAKCNQCIDMSKSNPEMICNGSCCGKVNETK